MACCNIICSLNSTDLCTGILPMLILNENGSNSASASYFDVQPCSEAMHNYGGLVSFLLLLVHRIISAERALLNRNFILQTFA